MNTTPDITAGTGTDDNVPDLDAIAESLLVPSADAAADAEAQAQPDAGQLPDDDRDDADAHKEEAPDDDNDDDLEAPDNQLDFLNDLGLAPDTAFEDEYDDEDEEDDGDADTTFQVRVEGEFEDVPLADLKSNYSLGKATKKRLEEATLERQRGYDEGIAEAVEASDKLYQQAQQRAGVIQTAYQEFNHILFAPMVEAPDAALRHSDPIAYMQAEADFRADQDRIQQQQVQAQNVFNEAEGIAAERQATAIKREKAALLRKIPTLKDPEKAKIYRDAVHRGAAGVGFTTEEVGSVYDHRLFLLSAKADAFDTLMAQMRGGKRPAMGDPPPQKETRRTRRSTMRPGSGKGNSSRRQKATARKRQEAAKKRALETGSVEDIAATLII